MDDSWWAVSGWQQAEQDVAEACEVEEGEHTVNGHLGKQHVQL
jgi:hypothetical protein